MDKQLFLVHTGLSGNVTMIFGVLLSGYLMKRYHPSSSKVAAFVAISKYVYAIGLIVVMVLSDCGFMSDLPGTMQTDGRSVDSIRV